MTRQWKSYILIAICIITATTTDEGPSDDDDHNKNNNYYACEYDSLSHCQVAVTFIP